MKPPVNMKRQAAVLLAVIMALPLFAEEVAPEEEDWDITMEGGGITLEESPPPSAPVLPETDNYGSRRNVVTAEQIREQGSLDLLDTLRDVPGVMFSKRNVIGTNTGNSLYVRGAVTPTRPWKPPFCLTACPVTA
jgi:outer membrane receptor for Fe3+-dicitrate